MVANFIGGYIPYIGAFLGGGLAVIVALGNGGLGTAAVMIVVLAANLMLENFVEPKVMGRTLDIHPLVVLVVTASAASSAASSGSSWPCPFTVIATNAIGRLRSKASASSWPNGPSPPCDASSNDPALAGQGVATTLGRVAYAIHTLD